MDVGAMMRAARQRHGLDQRSLALRARTIARHIGRIERGEVSPSVSTVAKLLEVMGELRAAAGPYGNQSVDDLRADHEQLTAGERVAQAAELSRALTSIAAAGD